MSDGDSAASPGGDNEPDGHDLDRVDELIREAKQGAEDNADQLRPDPPAGTDLTGRTEVERDKAEAESRVVEDCVVEDCVVEDGDDETDQ